ncbi:hypothetical protein RB195_016516 [Necator americanus]|uniref:Uncharacterized protein n=1 Tax=Necator americanus TaxID=51031 RepID=A0ABR1C2E0_NECAM
MFNCNSTPQIQKKSEASEGKTPKPTTIRQKESAGESKKQTQSGGLVEAKTQFSEDLNAKQCSEPPKRETGQPKREPKDFPKKEEKGNKKQASKPSYEKSTNSIPQPHRLPRAPKGQHEEELDQMEQILAEEASNMKML